MKNCKRSLLLFVIPVLPVFLAGCGQVTGRVAWDNSSPSSGTQSEEKGPPDVFGIAGVVIASPVRADGAGSGGAEVFGTFESLPRGWRLYAFLEDRYGFYLQYPPIRIDAARKTFSQRNILIGRDVTHLHVCLVDPRAASSLDQKATRSDWSGIPVLPDGVTIADSVVVRNSSGH